MGTILYCGVSSAAEQPEASVHKLPHPSDLEDADCAADPQSETPEPRLAQFDYVTGIGMLERNIARSPVFAPDRSRLPSRFSFTQTGSLYHKPFNVLEPRSPMTTRDMLFLVRATRQLVAEDLPADRITMMSLAQACRDAGRSDGGRDQRLVKEMIARIRATTFQAEWQLGDGHSHYWATFGILDSAAAEPFVAGPNSGGTVRLTWSEAYVALLASGSFVALDDATLEKIMRADELAARLWVFFEAEDLERRTPFRYPLYAAPRSQDGEAKWTPPLANLLRIDGWCSRPKVAARVRKALQKIGEIDPRYHLSMDLGKQGAGMWTISVTRMSGRKRLYAATDVAGSPTDRAGSDDGHQKTAPRTSRDSTTDYAGLAGQKVPANVEATRGLPAVLPAILPGVLPFSCESDEIDFEVVEGEVMDGAVEMNLPCTFDTFWQTWPNPLSKAQARATWQKMTGDEQLRSCLAAAAAAAAVACGEADARFVPGASRFLKERRWEEWQDGLPVGLRRRGGWVASGDWESVVRELAEEQDEAAGRLACSPAASPKMLALPPTALGVECGGGVKWRALDPTRDLEEAVGDDRLAIRLAEAVCKQAKAASSGATCDDRRDECMAILADVGADALHCIRGGNVRNPRAYLLARIDDPAGLLGSQHMDKLRAMAPDDVAQDPLAEAS